MSAKTDKPAAPPRTRNRDHERLYRPGLLSNWFLVWSVLLVVAIGIMVWKDYARPWKTYQRTFQAKRIEMVEDEVREQKESLAARAPEVQAARKAVDEAWQALQARTEPTHADLVEKRHMAKRLVDAQDAEVKRIKGNLAPARYEFETIKERHDTMVRAKSGSARFEKKRVTDDMIGDAAELMEERRLELNRWAQLLFEAETTFRNRADAHQRLHRQIVEMEAPWTEAKADLKLLKQEQAQAENALQGLQALYENNQWRNAPFIDFISPSLKVRQQVLENIHDNWNFATNKKVDRCTTCHLGIDFPAMGYGDEGAANIEKYDIDPWMQAHPGLDLIAGPKSPHKVESFGCSVCHHGVGWATDFARAAHLPPDAETKARWKDEHDWYKAKYIDFPMIPMAYVQGQCWKCHKQGFAWPVVYDEGLDHGFATGTGTDTGEALGQWRLPSDHPDHAGPKDRLLGPTEVHSDNVMPKAPRPVDGDLQAIAAAQRDALMEHYADAFEGREKDLEGFTQDAVSDYGWHAKVFERGYDTMVTYGCQGCHKIAEDFGAQVGYEAPPRVGPPLTAIGDKIKPEFIPQWILNPGAFRPASKMPSFFMYTPMDATWEPLRDGEGKPLVLPVTAAHMLDKDLAKSLGYESPPDEEDLIQLQVLALSTYLQNLKAVYLSSSGAKPGQYAFTRRDPGESKHYNADYDEALPAGDVARGRDLVNEKGCTACHVVPEVNVDGEWVADGPARFNNDPLLMRGPRLIGLGSKLKDGKWLNAWLKDPRHYQPDARMPDMRLIDRYEGDKQIAVGAQDRADVIAYLLNSRNEAFEALPKIGWKKRYEPLLRDMYETYFGKVTDGEWKGSWRRRAVVEGEMAGARMANVLAQVGERLMSRNGCFGCHEVAGHEVDQPIGVELTTHGIKDIHQLDFGVVPKSVIPHTRWDFFINKVRTPRVYDVGKVKPWADRLRMPRFSLWSPDAAEAAPDDVEAEVEFQEDAIIDSRVAVAGVLAGLVREPIKSEALFHPDDYERDLIAGRKVIKRYGCNNCHTIEGQQGYFWGEQQAAGLETAMLPPNLFGQGLRTRTDWLVKFLKDPVWLRPIVKAHMPRFGMSDAEAEALARYFIRLAGRETSLILPRPSSRLAGHRYDEPLTVKCEKDGHEIGPITGYVDEARRLFETINCNKCHLPKGSPGADPKEGGVAPSFSHAPERLRHMWVERLLYDPEHLINETKMPSFYPQERGYGRTCEVDRRAFKFWLRDDRAWKLKYDSDDAAEKAEAVKELAEVQIRALTDYLLHHYQPPAAAAGN